MQRLELPQARHFARISPPTCDLKRLLGVGDGGVMITEQVSGLAATVAHEPK